MKVNIKKLHENAVIPKYAKDGDAGLDLVATSVNENHLYIEYGTGLALEIPDNFVGLVFPRSSISNYNLDLSNSVGVIDSGYRGEVKFRFRKTLQNAHERLYNIGDKVGQLIILPYPKIDLIETSELSETQRGTGGYGSSGS